MKKWALRPALAEIERVSDISVTMKERKKPGTKTVEAIEFFISKNPAYRSAAPATLKQLPAAKVVTVDPATATFIEELRKEFALGPKQARVAVAKHGIEYVREKAVIVRSEPRPNAAKALAAAIRDDWQAGKQIEKKPPVKKAAASAKPAEPEPVVVSDEEWARRSAAVAQIKAGLKGGPKAPKAPDAQAELSLAAPVEEVEAVPF